MTETAPRIALIHAVTVAMAPIEAAFAEAWPEADRINLLDDALGPDRAAAGALTEAIAARIGRLGDYAVAAGADAILYTCSAFGPAIERVAARLDRPVLKPNEAMFAEALGAGERIGMVVTFGPSVASMEAEFVAAAKAAGSTATLETVLVAEAMDALRAGDAATHNAAVANAARDLAHCDAVLLAQFSTSRALEATEATIAAPVITAPGAAVRVLRQRLAAATMAG